MLAARRLDVEEEELVTMLEDGRCVGVGEGLARLPVNCRRDVEELVRLREDHMRDVAEGLAMPYADRTHE